MYSYCSYIKSDCYLADICNIWSVLQCTFTLHPNAFREFTDRLLTVRVKIYNWVLNLGSHKEFKIVFTALFEILEYLFSDKDLIIVLIFGVLTLHLTQCRS